MKGRQNTTKCAQELFFYAPDVMQILGVGQDKAYKTIRELRNEIKKKGLYPPPAGCIHKTFFCERFGLDLDTVEGILADEGTDRAM